MIDTVDNLAAVSGPRQPPTAAVAETLRETTAREQEEVRAKAAAIRSATPLGQQQQAVGQ